MSELKRSKGGGKGFGAVPSTRQKEPRPEEIVDIQSFPDGEWLQVRFVGSPVGYAQWWIEILTKKGVINIPKTALNFDSDTFAFDSTIEDPYENISNKKTRSIRYYSNAIIRDLQEDEPKKKPKWSKTEKKSGVKDKGSKSWTPVRVLQIPNSLAQDLQKLTALNRVKSTKKGKTATQSYELSDPKYGCDVFIMYDSSATGNKMYSCQKGERSPLTEEELEYLVYPLTGIMKPEPYEIAVKEAAALEGRKPDAQDEDDEDDDEDDDFDKPMKKKKKKKKSSDSDSSKKKSKSKSKSGSKDKGADKPKSKKKKKSSDSDSSKKKKKKKSK